MNCFSWQRFAALAACGVLLAASQAFGQEYPSKPIRLNVGFAPGGQMDVYARVIAKLLQDRLKTPVFVENRPGAGGLVGADAVVKSAPDGYTLTHIAPSSVSRVFIKDPPFDVYKALQPIASVWVAQFVLTINTQVPAKTLKEFVDYVKANPGKVNWGSGNGLNYLPMVLFQSLAGMQMQPIEYSAKGGLQLTTALVTNEVQATFNTIQSILNFLDSGKLRVLAVTGSQRMSVVPNAPTTTEAGYPGMQAHVVGTIMAPAGVPSAVVAKLSPILKDVVSSPEMEKLMGDNVKPLIVGPEELTRLLREELANWEHAAKVAGFKPQ